MWYRSTREQMRRERTHNVAEWLHSATLRRRRTGATSRPPQALSQSLPAATSASRRPSQTVRGAREDWARRVDPGTGQPYYESSTGEVLRTNSVAAARPHAETRGTRCSPPVQFRRSSSPTRRGSNGAGQRRVASVDPVPAEMGARTPSRTIGTRMGDADSAAFLRGRRRTGPVADVANVAYPGPGGGVVPEVASSAAAAWPAPHRPSPDQSPALPRLGRRTGWQE